MRMRKVSRAIRQRNRRARATSSQSASHSTPLIVEFLEQRLLLSASIWQPMGPSPTENGQVEGIGSQNNPVMGAIHTVVAHPTDPNILYIGAVNGGIWKTTNATATNPNWTPLTDFQSSLSIGDLEFDPTDGTNQTLVAGIGTFSSFGRTGGAWNGLLRTTDGGGTWTALNDVSITGQNITGVAERGSVILATSNDFNFNGGLFRSINTGATFSLLSNDGTSGLPAGAVSDLVADPGNNSRFYVAVLPTINQFTGAISTQGGIFRSDDSGTTWTNVTDASVSAAVNAAATFNANNNTWNGVNNIEIAVHDNQGAGTNSVYTGVILRGLANGFFRSTNQGGAWTAMDIPQTNENGIVGLQPHEDPGAQGAVHFSIIADPNDDSIVYVGGDRQPHANEGSGGPVAWPNSIGANDYSGRLFRGDADLAPGSQWTPLTHVNTANNSAPHADSRDMAFDANGNIIETDDGGIYRRTSPTSNSGIWVSLNSNLQVTEFHDIAWDSISDIVIGGAQDTGTPQQKSTGSFTWTDVQTADGGDVAVDTITLAGSGQSIRYSSTQRFSNFIAEIYDSANAQIGPTLSPALTTTGGGTTLVTGNNGNMQFVTPLELNAIDPTRMIIGGANSLYESTDQGATVQEIATFGINRNAMAYGGTLGGVGDASIIYVGSGSQVFRRTPTDGGNVVATPTQPAGAGTILDIELDPDDWQTAYVLDANGVYRTTNAGGMWTNVTGDLTGGSNNATNLQTIMFATAAGFDAVIVGSLDGVFAMSTDQSGQWIELGSSSLPNVPVWDMDFDAGDDILLAGTLGRGAWSITEVSQALLGDVSGTVWADTNGDGVQDVGEPGLSGVTVQLRNAGDDSLVDSIVTDGSGNYLFEPVPGDYYIEIVEPTEHSLSPRNQGGDDALDSDPDRITHQTDSFTVLVDQAIDRDAGMIVPDWLEQNDSFGSAADMGVLPGVHINYLTISDPGDDDYYRLELLRPDDVDIEISFTQSFGDLNLQFLNDVGSVIATSDTGTGVESLSLTGLIAGTYYVRVYSDDPGVTGDVNVYDIAMDPGATSTTRMIYVNDGNLTNDYYTQATGNNANDGLTPLTPKATLQNVLDTYILGLDDLILIDTGTYPNNAVIAKGDESAAYGGTPSGSAFTGSGTNIEIIDADFDIFYELTFQGTTGIYAHSDGFNPSTDNEYRSSIFSGNSTAIRIDAGERDVIRDNTILAGSTYGARIEGGVDLHIHNNNITGRGNGIYLNSAVTALVEDNMITAGTRGIYVLGGTNGAELFNNTISTMSSEGILVTAGSASAIIEGNDISFAAIGIDARSALTAPIQNNTIHDNAVGIKAYGIIGAADWASGMENDVYDNTTGIWARNGAEVRFNRIHHNDTGIYVPEDNITLHHNVIYRNTNYGVFLNDGDNIGVVNNTIYTPAGDGVRLTNFSSNVSLRNNIVWTASGYDLYVETNSQVGFASDYNNFFTSASGIPVWWQKDFVDLFDWQVEAAYDSHSIGYTALDPTLDDPQFVSLGGDDYHLTDIVSTSIDAGDPSDLLPNEPGPAGDRINLGAYGNTTEAALSPTAYIAIDYPNYYTDWPLATPGVILWHSFNLAGNMVDIELYQDGVGLIDTLATAVPVAAGSFSWTPFDSGLTGSNTDRYFIRLVVSAPSLTEDSRELFSVPPASDDFYIDDNSNTNDEYTPTATGDNRATGASPNYPKANLLPLLTNYDLGPGDTIHIDTGDYIHVRNVILSGGVGLGNDEGATYTGPTDPAKIAQIDRANPYAGSTNIDITDGDFVTLANLTLVGAERGLWVHNGSTNFDGSNLTFIDNTLDGLLMESDAEASTVDQLVAYDNGRDGIVILTPVASVSNSEVYDNGRYGIYVSTPSSGVSNTLISDNEVYGNANYGIYASGDNSNAITVQNNKVHNNSNYGIFGIENTLITLNTVYDHNATNTGGIFLQSGATAHQNVVHSNYHGIVGQYTTSNTITNNTVYNNTVYGIAAYNASTIDGNRSYSNAIGIQTLVWGTFTGSVDNNIVYGNATHGIVVNRANTGATVNNNTIYQLAGDALRVHDSSQNLQVRNNIFWATSATGHGLYVDNNSQTGFTSDYNIFYTIDPISSMDTGNAGYWQGASRKTLIDWQNTSFDDGNSLQSFPLFEDYDGAGDILGYVSPADDGRDDDFHLESEYGRFTGGLTPFIDGGTGLPVLLPSVELLDTAQSPAIDRGDAVSAFGNEPAPNGGFINIGAYGNTSQASKSPLEYVLVLKPDGGETWPAGQTFPIRWRSDIMDPTNIVPGPQSTYSTEVLTENPVGYWHLNEAGATAFDASANTNDGAYLNGVTQSVAGFLLGDDAAAFDGSNDLISIPDDASLNPAAISVEAWIRPDTGISTWDSVLTKSSSSSWTDGYGMYYDGAGNIVFFVNNYSTVKVQAPVTLDQWQHVAATYSVADGNLRLYINGVEADTFAYSSAVTHSANVLQIGQGTGSSSYTWKGRLDEVAIYDAALPASDIADHFTAGLGVVTEVDIELIRDGDGGFNVLLADDTLNDGEFLWTIDGGMAPPNTDYRIRVTRTDNVLLTDTSNNPFEITAPINRYYVNDGIVFAGDWTMAPGSAANDGLTQVTPKDSIRGVLEQYDLEPGDEIWVDTGFYTVTNNIIVTAADSGIKIVGYNGGVPGRFAELDRANSSQDVFEIQTDDVTLSYLHVGGGRDGVHATNADNLTVENSRIFNNSRYGVFFDAASSGGTATNNEFDGSGSVQDYGIYAQGSGVTITDNNAFEHSQYGFLITGDGAVVTGNESYANAQRGFSIEISSGALINQNRAYSNNSYGFYVQGSFSETQIDVTENTSFGNISYGFYFVQNVLGTDNTAYGQSNTNNIGFHVSSGAIADGNTAYDNYHGFVGQYTTTNTIINNTAYNNTVYGIVAYNASTIEGNTVYSNDIGIANLVWSRFTGSIQNNLSYDNTSVGIQLNRTGAGSRIANNTVYQLTGDSLQVLDDSDNALLRNNILVNDGGYALKVSADSQDGFDSDYNLFYVTGTGVFGQWEGIDFTTRVDWFFELGLDGNSLVGNPDFVDPNGIDGFLGYSMSTIGVPVVMDDGDAGYVQTAGIWTSIGGDGGLNDDYDRSDNTVFGDDTATWTFSGLTAGTYEVAVTWRAVPSGTFINATNAPYEIIDGTAAGDVILTRRINQRVVPNDFNDGTTDWENLATVIVTGTELTVRLTDDANGYVVADAVRIQQIEGDTGIDDDFHLMNTSPGIDNGDLIDPYVNEPAPNGGRINIGRYGNTSEAALSPAELVQVLSPNGLEKFEHNQQITITWRTVGLAATLIDIELIDAGTLLPVLQIADDIPDSGLFDWIIPGSVTPEMDYLIRVSATAAPMPTDDSNTSFVITNDGNQFYINDDTVIDVNDWTTNPGDNAKSGKTPDNPMRSLTGLLAAYNLDPNDVINVDNGSYRIIKDILVGTEDAGVAIIGYNDMSFPIRVADLDRGNTVGDTFDIPADDVSLSYLTIHGGRDGVRIEGGNNAVIHKNRIYNNVRYGVIINSAADGATITDNTFEGTDRVQDYGAYVDGTNVTITGNIAYDHNQDGFYVTGNGLILEDNISYLNRGQGFQVSNSSGAVIYNNTAYANDSYGFYVQGSGSEALTTVTNNLSHSNLSYGFYISSNVIADGNTSYNHTNTNNVGIYVVSGATVRNNEVYDNYDGIVGQYTTSNNIYDNTVYNNARYGIAAYNGSVVSGNTVFSNSIGIEILVWSAFSGSVDHNLVYDNANHGIIINRGNASGRVANNTVFQDIGNALLVRDSTQDTVIRNNILWSSNGYAINVSDNSQIGFDSDYNLFYVSGLAVLGNWQSTDIADLKEWFYETGADRNSHLADPQFVDPDGPDNLLGYSELTVGPALIIDDDDSGFVTNGTWDPAADGGYNGDYERSEESTGVDTATWTFSSLTPGTYQVAVTWHTVTSGTFRNATDSPYEILDGPVGSDVISYRRMNQRAAPNDFNDSGVDWENLATVVITGSELTVRLSDDANDYVVADAVRIQRIEGNRGGDDTFHLQSASPGIDNGDPTDPFAAEPAPNGGRINVGRYGDTSEATTSPAELIQVFSPNGMERFELGDTMPITWHTFGLPGTTINIDLMDGVSVASSIAVGTTDDGSFDWVIPGFITPETEYTIRVTTTTGSLPSDQSDEPFVIANDGTDYYINDETVLSGDWTMAPGDNANSGKTIDYPMASLNALVAAYDLDPGDIIWVDTGDYTLLNTVILALEDTGVIVRGYDNGAFPTRRAVLDRANPDRYVFDIFAGNVTLQDMDVQSGLDGIHTTNADGLLAQRLYLFDNQRYGIQLSSDSADAVITDNEFNGNAGVQDYGVYAQGFHPTIISNTSYDHQQDGIYVAGNNAIVQTNETYGNHGQGIEVNNSAGALITDNTVHNNDSYGIYAPASYNEAQVQVESNIVFDNLSYGIYGSGNVLITGNTSYGHSNTNNFGIYLVSGAIADGNIVHSNYDGIVGQYTTSNTVINNFIYNNSQTGVTVYNNSFVSGNHIYSNSVGVQTLVWTAFTGTIENNLIYANTNQGIIVNRAGSGGNVTNNTIYQEVGDALRVQDSSVNLEIRNNIFWVEAGYAINVDPNSQTGFDSDYNIFLIGTDPNAHLGLWSLTDYDTLGNWQGASGGDASSLATDPLFVDPNGADNILGYSTAGAGFNGGSDDNFLLAATSPAIDRADSFPAPPFDIDGNARVDDPSTPNTGSNDYVETNLGPNSFPTGGVAQNWRSTNNNWLLALPFTFNFYGVDYTSVYVTANGFLQFGTNSGANDDTNSTAELLSPYPRIAALWDNLQTNGTGDDIFIDTSVANQITIRWDATNQADSTDVNFSVTLYDTGHIRFDYGSGNTNLTPTVGISAGDGQHYEIAAHNTAAILTDVDTLEFTLQPGFVDIGAYEFLGNSADVDPPTVVNVTPGEIAAETITNLAGGIIQIEFSEAINPIDALALANYDLRQPGLNGVYNDTNPSDDIIYAIQNILYTPGSTLVTLVYDVGALQSGPARFTIDGTSSIHDLAGLRLDGDSDTFAGGDYVRFFDIDVEDPTLTDWTLSDDTGIDPDDKITADNTLTLTLNFTENIFGVDSDVDILDPLATSITPANIAGWGTTTLMITLNPLSLDGEYTVTLDASMIQDNTGNLLNSGTDEVLNFTLDRVAPQVTQVTINNGGVQRSNVSVIEIEFDDAMNLGQLIAMGTVDDYIKLYDAFDLLTPLAWLNETHFAWDGGTNKLTIDLTVDGFGGSELTNLPDGSYALLVDTTQVEDLAGNDLTDDDGTVDATLHVTRSTGSGSHDFFRLLADANGDRRVNMDDYNIWDLNYDPLGQTANDPGQGDFNLDGLISGLDLLIWQRQYNDVDLPEPPSAPASSSSEESDSISPTILSVQVNHGEAQRSIIEDISVQFSEDVQLDYTALGLFNRTASSILDLSSLGDVVFNYDPESFTASWALSNVITENGIYTATIRAADVSDSTGNALDGNGDQTAGDDYTFAFHRLLADSNGDGRVNRKDRRIWRNNLDPNGLNTNTAGMGDWNIDGQIDKLDLSIWKKYRGHRLLKRGDLDDLLLAL